jgi:triosephosphate isomerase
MRRPIIAGNWKMNKTVNEAEEFTKALKEKLQDIAGVDIVICPPFTCLAPIAGIIQGANIQLGAQDIYWEDSGAFTGEISCPMLKELGCKYVIIGHSERRAYFSETNESVNKKIKAVLRHNLIPIMCVGERLEEREKGKTFEIIKSHLQDGLKDLTAEQIKRTVIAYEPVWAIGTGRTATPNQAQEVHRYIRSLLAELYDRDTAVLVRIQYGGSVKPENIAELMVQEDVDGSLVGGASLNLDSFVRIVKAVRQ